MQAAMVNNAQYTIGPTLVVQENELETHGCPETLLPNLQAAIAGLHSLCKKMKLRHTAALQRYPKLAGGDHREHPRPSREHLANIVRECSRVFAKCTLPKTHTTHRCISLKLPLTTCDLIEVEEPLGSADRASYEQAGTLEQGPDRTYNCFEEQ